MKFSLRNEWLPLLMILVLIVAGFYFHSIFPDQVPIHWNAEGEIDNYGSKFIGAFLAPLIAIGVYLLFVSLPLIDPKKDRYKDFSKTYHLFKTLIIGYLLYIFFISSFNAIGYNIPVEFAIPVGVGVLFILLGNYMGKIKPNWFMGIRTPWTLSSEEVWNKTHRFSGKIFVLGGIIISSLGFWPVYLRMPILMIVILLVVISTVVYSYLIYRKKKD
ncbi:SdpI family protein [Candidatus Falkowbacteria bacterium]|jgi:uncharacterized membrane protein|nr:SdpI family protein [Candidatus Falkowbacteria bacterium]